MIDFTISLAGIPIAVSSFYPMAKEYCEDYLCDAEPKFTVVMTEEDIAAEHVHSSRQREAEGLPPRRFSDAYIETLALLRRVSERLLDFDVVLFHGSTVAVDGKAYLFTARSGTGKTTHTKLWLSQLPQAYVLNGDKPFLKVAEDGAVFACGTPWRGKEQYGCNEILPLEAVCLLERDTKNHIEALSAKEGINVLLRQTHFPNDGASMLKALKVVEGIARGTRLYRLGCNMEPEAARVSIGAMVGDAATEGSRP